MSKNIKDIGKELMGKSLNSFHRKTGLTQLEKNNEMQDGILNGILSQVDDAYIEKTEQSNVIHLDGSGDGVVVLDSIEGNTMVNLVQGYGKGSTVSYTSNNKIFVSNLVTDRCHIYSNLVKPNTKYTLLTFGKLISTGNFQQGKANDGFKSVAITTIKDGIYTFVTDVDCDSVACNLKFADNSEVDHKTQKVVLLEGDFTNREVNYFEGLQSSFEEKVNDEGKYEIEILSQNRNLLNRKNIRQGGFTWAGGEYYPPSTDRCCTIDYIKVKAGETLYRNKNCTYLLYDKDYKHIGNDFVGNKTTGTYSNTAYIVEQDVEYIHVVFSPHPYGGNPNTSVFDNAMISYSPIESYIDEKHNKIKVLLNSPLLKGDEIVCKEDGLYHYHKRGRLYKLDTAIWREGSKPGSDYHIVTYIDNKTGDDLLSDKCKVSNLWVNGGEHFNGQSWYRGTNIVYFPDNNILTREGALNRLKELNPIIEYTLKEPYYEKITNEYGEPIILKGYENGTLYIDSVIVPTTTVRYTPKMESFKTYKEVKIRNTINDFDVTENVIPYMMEVDMKLTKLETSAFSTYNIKNIRKMGVLDMTSMQERTFKMLERLIRGKSHTKQEMIDRVLLYEQAKRITTEQALELNLIIEEVYGV